MDFYKFKLPFLFTFLTLCYGINISTAQYDSTWIETQKLIPSDGDAGDLFGVSLAVHNDYAFIASPDQDVIDGTDTIKKAGVVYVFHRNVENEWVQHQKLSISNKEAFDRFGLFSVAIDSNTAVIGAPKEDENAQGLDSLNKAGSVFVFQLDNNGQWIEKQKLVASDRAINDEFGTSVAISGDYIIVGSPFEDEDANGGNTRENTGSAYVFHYNANKNEWGQSQKLVGSPRNLRGNFGLSVSLHHDKAIIGAPRAELTGAGYVFEKDSTGLFVQKARIVPSDAESNDRVGESVSIHENTLSIGAPFAEEDSMPADANTGAVYLYTKNNNDQWIENQKVKASDIRPDASFGSSLSMTKNHLAVGAYNWFNNIGKIYFFDKNGDWKETHAANASDGFFFENFGASVGIDNNTVIAGANFHRNEVNQNGAAYVFEKCEYKTKELTITACNQYTVPSGDTTYLRDGTFYDIIPNEVGCDSLYIIHLNIDSVDAKITKEENTLVALTPYGDYQWLECGNNYTPVQNETDSIFTPSEIGSYGLEVTHKGCKDTSICYFILNVSSKHTQSIIVNIFPNPVQDLLSIHLDKQYKKIEASIFSINGQKLISKNFEYISNFTIPTTFMPGAYYIEITTPDNRIFRQKFLKE